MCERQTSVRAQAVELDRACAREGEAVEAFVSDAPVHLQRLFPACCT